MCTFNFCCASKSQITVSSRLFTTTLYSKRHSVKSKICTFLHGNGWLWILTTISIDRTGKWPLNNKSVTMWLSYTSNCYVLVRKEPLSGRHFVELFYCIFYFVDWRKNVLNTFLVLDNLECLRELLNELASRTKYVLPLMRSEITSVATSHTSRTSKDHFWDIELSLVRRLDLTTLIFNSSFGFQLWSHRRINKLIKLDYQRKLTSLSAIMIWPNGTVWEILTTKNRL